MKLYSSVQIPPSGHPFRLDDRITILGSCFADSVGVKLQQAGFRTCINPFGTLYNPASLRAAVARLDGTETFGPSDCVTMGAGAGRICSFEHHTSFSRPTAEEFLQNANACLQEARDFWVSSNRVILSLGTSFVWETGGRVVSNCLKRPSSEFTRRLLDTEECVMLLKSIIAAHPEKRFLLTVSPIRHLGNGAHENAVSKARLLLAVDECPEAEYFPAFEILCDELRDYRFYAEDLVHPSPTAVSYIWERFLDSFTLASEKETILQNEKTARLLAHRPLAK